MRKKQHQNVYTRTDKKKDQMVQASLNDATCGGVILWITQVTSDILIVCRDQIVDSSEDCNCDKELSPDH